MPKQKLYDSESYYLGDLFVTHNKHDNPKGCVLFLHGYPATKEKNRDLVELFAINGYDTILPHYAGLGFSKGEWGFEKSRNDMEKLLKTIKSEKPDCPFSIVGHSWGGFLALQLAEEVTDKLILLAPLSYIPSVEDNTDTDLRYRTFDGFINFLNAISPKHSACYTKDELKGEISIMQRLEQKGIETLKSKSVGVYIVHGQDDSVIPLRHSESLVSKLNEQHSVASFLSIKDDHSFTLNRESFIDTLKQWILQ